jgi:alkylation response protein AidB-like acyl-CoA dehydrogenase
MAVEALSTAVPVEPIASHAPAVDREGRFPEEGIEALRASGLLALCVPPSLGGPGGGPLEMVDVVEQVAGACASTAMVYVMHVVGAQTLVAGTGPDEEGPKADALEAIAAGRHLTTLAYSERGSRGHFWAQVSRARAKGAGVVLDADKSWATAAGHVDSYVLACGAAGLEGPLETELYLADAGDPAIAVPRAFDGLGLRGNMSAPLEIRGLRLAADRRLGEAASGFGLMMTATLPWFALGSAACSVGIAGAALRAAADHAARARFEHLGQSLADLQTVRARLASAGVRHMEARAFLHEVAGAVAAGDPSAQLGVLAVKASAAEMAIEVTEAAMRIGGGAAYSRSGSLERHLRDARAASVMAPSTDVLHDFLGKALTGQELF